jgi:undecaprenyl diphosphate synthase
MSDLHVAIIMDGNGRWAKNRGKKRTEGHKVGSEVVRDITTFASQHKDIAQLTLYAFSTENWKRPKLEVDFLMKLLADYLESEKETYLKNGVRFKAIGDRSRFSKRLQKAITQLEEDTENETSLIQNLALNYGGKDEIVRAVKKLQISGDEVSEESIEQSLDLPTAVDILIRTGGDHRVSNFLLWQSAYAELFFLDTLWPDFKKDDLSRVLNQFQGIERRFGGVEDE